MRLSAGLATLNPFRRNGTPAPRPDPPDEPQPGAEDTGALVQMVRERYEYARRAKWSMMGTWVTCLAFLVGDRNQWSKWDSRLQRMTDYESLPKNTIRVVDNQFPAILRGLASRLTRATEKPVCLGFSDDPEEKEAAENSSRVLQHFWREEMQAAEYEANVTRCLFGSAILNEYWDPSKTAWIPRPVPGAMVQDPQTGEQRPRVEPILAAVGDLCCEVLTPLDVFPEPARKWSDVSWCVVARRKPVLWIEDTFGVKVAAEDSREEDAVNALLPGDLLASTGAEGDRSGPVGARQATLLIYYEARSRRHPRGRHLIVCGQQLLYPEKGDEDRLPLPHGEIPLTMFGFDLVPTRLWPKGPVEDLLDNQRELNRHQSSMAQMHRAYRSPKRWIDLAWGVTPEDITDAVDEIIEANIRGVNPAEYLEKPVDLPAWIVEYGEAQYQGFQRKSGLNEVLMGQRPPGVNTATGLVTLQREAAQGLSAPGFLGMLALQNLAERINICQCRMYREDRYAMLLGRQRGSRQAFLVESGSFGIRPVQIDLTDGVQDTEELRQQQLTEWFASPVAQAPLELQAALAEEVGLKWLSETLTKLGPQLQAQAQEQQAAQQQQAQAEAQGQQQAAEQQQQLQGAAAQQQMATKGAASEQDLRQKAVRQAVELDQAQRRHEMELRHAEEGHRASMAQQAAAAKLARERAKVRPTTRGSR